MALLLASFAAVRLSASSFASNVLFRTSKRAMTEVGISGGSMGHTWKDKEHAAETAHFNKEDALLLQKLAAKLKKTTEPSADLMSREKTAIAKILEKYGIEAPDAALEEIAKRKFGGL